MVDEPKDAAGQESNIFDSKSSVVSLLDVTLLCGHSLFPMCVTTMFCN